MKPALIAIIGFIGLISVFLFQLYIALFLVLLNSLALCFVLCGTLVPVKSRTGRMMVHLRQNSTSASSESASPCLAGVRIDPDLRSFLEFHVEPRGLFFLMLAGVLSLSAIAFALQAHPNLFSPYTREDSGEFALLFVCAFLSVIPLSIGVSWFRERMLLLQALVTIGCLDARSGAYNFEDRNGGGYGGTSKMSPIHPKDNICLVFYSRNNPQLNRSSSGLAFHQLVIHWS